MSEPAGAGGPLGGPVAPVISADRLKVSRLPHLPDLDGLRAVAVGIVWLGHTELLPRFPSGFGVTLFFVLSGYLITTLMRIELADTGRVSLRSFYVRRLLRINPPLFITLAFMGLLVLMGAIKARPDPLSVLSQAFFFSNYMPHFGKLGLPSPLWSLAVEEHFYLIFPAVFLLAMRMLSARQLAAWCLGVCAVVLLVRILNVELFGIVEANYYWTHTRIDSILFGCALALWANPVADKEPAWRARGWHAVMAIAVILVTFGFKGDLLREGLRYTLQCLSLVVLFNYQLQGTNKLSPILRWRPVQLLGWWSYTFYLVHFALLVAVRTTMPDLNPLLSATLALVLALLYSACMYTAVERPLAKLRRRLNSAR